MKLRKKRYPKLWQCMKEIREDNDLPFEEWGGVRGEDIIIVPDSYTNEKLINFEKSLVPLSDKEIEDLTKGETTVQEQIIKKYNIEEADDFLTGYFNEWMSID